MTVPMTIEEMRLEVRQMAYLLKLDCEDFVDLAGEEDLMSIIEFYDKQLMIKKLKDRRRENERQAKSKRP